MVSRSRWGDLRRISRLAGILAQQSVGVLVRATLPQALGVAEMNLDSGTSRAEEELPRPMRDRDFELVASSITTCRASSSPTWTRVTRSMVRSSSIARPSS
jgi:hypothetical protein